MTTSVPPDLPPGDAYDRLLADRPELFAPGDPAGIRLVTDRAERSGIEAMLAERFSARGQPADWARAGLYYTDPWVWLVRDVVVFPDGNPGTHHRMISRIAQSAVVMLPVLDGRVVLIRHFRHGIRGWSWEVPRGAAEHGDGLGDSIRIELAEEVGAMVAGFVPLGISHNHNNVICTTMRHYLVQLASLGEPSAGEGIVGVRLVEPDRMLALIEAGDVTDASSIIAFALARLKGLL